MRNQAEESKEEEAKEAVNQNNDDVDAANIEDQMLKDF